MANRGSRAMILAERLNWNKDEDHRDTRIANQNQQRQQVVMVMAAERSSRASGRVQWAAIQ